MSRYHQQPPPRYRRRTNGERESAVGHELVCKGRVEGHVIFVSGRYRVEWRCRCGATTVPSRRLHDDHATAEAYLRRVEVERVRRLVR